MRKTLSGLRKGTAIAVGGLAGIVGAAGLVGCKSKQESPEDYIAFVSEYTSEHNTPDRDKILTRYRRAKEMDESEKEKLLDYFESHKEEIEANDNLKELRDQMTWAKKIGIESLRDEDKIYLYFLAREEATREIFP